MTLTKQKKQAEYLSDWALMARTIRLDAEARGFHFIALCAGALEQAAQAEVPDLRPHYPTAEAANDQPET